MPKLSTLSEDLCLEIVDRLLENSDGPKNRITGLRNLSLVSSSLNYFCGYVIFRTYCLDIRRSHWKTTGVYPKGSTAETWDGGAISQRLAHLREKSPFVREIYITDQGESSYRASAPSGMVAFHPDFIPELLSTLYLVRGLTAVHLVTHSDAGKPNTILDPELWKWIHAVRPSTFSLIGHFEVPKGEILRPIASLDTLRLHSCTNANKVLIDIHKPRNLSLIYSSSQKDCFSYKPDAHNLEDIRVEINLQGREHGLTEPLFDFSKVSQAMIYVSVKYVFDYSRGAPTWQYLRPLLQPLFAEDLSKYDVHCYEPGTVNITWSPKEGWNPKYQDHLEES